MDDMSITVRKKNKLDVLHYGSCDELINDLRAIETFLDDMLYISLGRNCILCGKLTFSLQHVLVSVELTMGSIISCCESACIADAYSYCENIGTTFSFVSMLLFIIPIDHLMIRTKG